MGTAGANFESVNGVAVDTLGNVNVVGTASVLRAAKDVGTIRRVVSASSMAVYADAPRQMIGQIADVHIATGGPNSLAGRLITHDFPGTSAISNPKSAAGRAGATA